MPKLEKMVGDLVSAMSDDNITMKAMKECFREGTGAKLIRVIPFTSAVKYSAVVLERELMWQVRQSLYSGRIIQNMRREISKICRVWISGVGFWKL